MILDRDNGKELLSMHHLMEMQLPLFELFRLRLKNLSLNNDTELELSL